MTKKIGIMLLLGICIFICIGGYAFVKNSFLRNNTKTFVNEIERGSIEKIDFEYKNLKLLTAKYFSYNKHDMFIAGTEIPKNTWNTNSGVIFVYDITQEEMILCKKINGLASMTSIYDAGDSIFLGGICSSNKEGCYLYRYDKDTGELEQKEHFDGRGIWALTGDGKDQLFVSTSDPIALYSYDIIEEKSKEINRDFSDEAFVRSLSYLNGFCYLGLGTHAGMIRMDPVDGSYLQILPEKYYGETFVYAQDVYDGSIYFLLSPSCKIIKYDPQSMEFSDTKNIYHQNLKSNNRSNNKTDGAYISLLGNIFSISDNVTRQEQYGTIASFLGDGGAYGVDASGILHKVNEGKDIDLFEFIEINGIVPNHYIVYNDNIYVPERRFVRYDYVNNEKSVFIVDDEPQAVVYNEQGLFTANYTECTEYFYPWAVLSRKSYSVNLNEKKYLLADIDNQCRPFDLLIVEDKLLLASGPLYGKFGGAVTCYDRRSQKVIYTDINIIENQSIVSFGNSKRNHAVWIGTSCYGENTTPSCVNEPSHLFLWDYEEEEIVLDIVPDRDNKSVGEIIERDGVVYCILRDGKLCAFDSDTGKKLFEAEDTVQFRQLVENTQGDTFVVSKDTIWKISDNFEIIPMIIGFSNLSNMVQDVITGNLYVYDNDNLYKLSNDVIG